MKYFFETVETIPEGVGFNLFSRVHLAWFAVFAVVVVTNCLLYRKLEARGRDRWRKTIAWLLIADEVYKMAILIYSGNYIAEYLPLHLCSINIIIIAIHAYKPLKIIDSFLYTTCIPGALAALLFPSWASLPLANGMHIHSFTVHILLAMYPLVLAVNGDIRPSVKHIPKTLGLLLAMAVPIYGVNLLLDTNFMFLMFAEEGNPLYWFAQNLGSHLLGYPVIIIGVLVVMYGPVIVAQKWRKKHL